jgi:predicted short-subunit dehydrogenase-like oxidoreductase (DUF2520 family)
MNIVLLGSGNVATQLGRAFKLAGQDIVQVWSRDIEHARELADNLAATAISDFDYLDRKADLYIISVKDEAINELARELKVSNKLIVHTSGSTGIDVLEGSSSKYGVLYPLQTFSKTKVVDFRQIPFAIEGNTPEVTSTIHAIADRLSERVIELSSEQRKSLHIAAVFACNFSNHLYALGQELMKEQNLDFDLLRPLIAETAAKVQSNDPLKMQTGPASRGDQETIDAHLDLLKNNPEIQDIYKKLSQSIVNLQERSKG